MRALLASFAAVTALLVAGCSSSSDAPDQQWAIVQNHFFIDHLPKTERDMVKQIAFIDHEDAGKIGIRGASSRFRFFGDLFTWQRQGNQVASKILQTGDTVRGSFRAWRCKGQAPAPLELCLELKEGDKTRTYYSRHDWIIESPDAASSAFAHVPLDE